MQKEKQTVSDKLVGRSGGLTMNIFCLATDANTHAVSYLAKITFFLY